MSVAVHAPASADADGSAEAGGAAEAPGSAATADMTRIADVRISTAKNLRGSINAAASAVRPTASSASEALATR